MQHEAPLVKPSAVSTFKPNSPGRPTPSTRFLYRPNVLLGSSGIFEIIFSCKELLTLPETVSMASIVIMSESCMHESTVVL